MTEPVAVTFDCWSTLLFEREPGATFARRIEIVAHAVRTWDAGTDEVRRSLERAWRRHIALWQEGVASGAADMAGWALAELAEARGLPAPPAEEAAALGAALAEALLVGEVLPLPTAGETLEALAARGLRRALICDTGFAGADVVRCALERAGLLAHLEVTVFSDEAGVPKPHPRVFEQALTPLGLAARPEAAVHVGDLRRTDVAGARRFGMASVRIRAHYDDQSELPDADRVADDHAHLRALLAVA